MHALKERLKGALERPHQKSPVLRRGGTTLVREGGDQKVVIRQERAVR